MRTISFCHSPASFLGQAIVLINVLWGGEWLYEWDPKRTDDLSHMWLTPSRGSYSGKKCWLNWSFAGKWQVRVGTPPKRLFPPCCRFSHSNGASDALDVEHSQETKATGKTNLQKPNFSPLLFWIRILLWWKSSCHGKVCNRMLREMHNSNLWMLLVISSL